MVEYPPKQTQMCPITICEADMGLQQQRSTTLVNSTAVDISCTSQVRPPIHSHMLQSATAITAVSAAPGGHEKESLPSSLCCRRWETRPGDCSCVVGRGSEMAPERSKGTGLSLAGDTPLLATSAAFSCSRSWMTSMRERCLRLCSDRPEYRFAVSSVLQV